MSVDRASSAPRAALQRALISCVALAAAGAPGCYRTAQLDIVRPAMLNGAPYGNTYDVRPVEGDPEAGEQIRANLRARIVNSLNRAIVLLETGGSIAVQANVRSVAYNENETRAEATCSHTERVGGRDVSRNHPCTSLVRTGELRAQVEFRVLVAATNHVLFSRSYDSARTRRVTGRVGPYPADTVAMVAIDPVALRAEALDDVVAQFAPVILPWRDTVEVNFEGCDGDARCTQAYEAVQQRALEPAEQLVTQVIGQEGAPVAEAQRVRVGEAYYNRAMVRMLRGTYGGAFIDLQRAIELQPQRDTFRQRYRQLEQLARDQEALREQHGVSETPEAQPQAQPAPVLGASQQ